MDTDKLYDRSTKIMNKLKPFIAIFVLVFIVMSCIGLYNNNQLKTEIAESCGYEHNEKVYCICDKTFVSQFDIIDNPYYNRSQDPFNLTLDPEIN